VAGKRRTRSGHYVLECERRPTGLGWGLRVQIERYDGRRMGWEELHRVFTQRYPGKWAVQVFPPLEHTYNGANKYHLLVLDEAPSELDLGRTDEPPKRRRGVQPKREVTGSSRREP
jgi:hypothetical protein